MCERKKVLMLATTAAMIEQFNKQNIKLLCEMGYEVHVVGNFYNGNPISDERLDDFKIWLDSIECKWFNNVSSRNPFDIWNNYMAYKNVIKLIEENHYIFIHCHNPVGSVIGRLAGHKTNTKVIYTAHGFHFYKGAPIINWLLYYPVEKMLSRWTTCLVTMNEEDYILANSKFYANRIHKIHGIGIDVSGIEAHNTDTSRVRKELGLNDNELMLLSVGELIPRKNHETVIKAISRIKNKRIKYFICGKGPLEKRLRNLIHHYRLEKVVFLLGFRNDVLDLYKASDLFVFPSIQEGLPVSLLEAMASKTFVIASRIRGNVDLISDSHCLFDVHNYKQLSSMIDEYDSYSGMLITGKYDSIIEPYNDYKVYDEMKEIYGSVIS